MSMVTTERSISV